MATFFCMTISAATVSVQLFLPLHLSARLIPSVDFLYIFISTAILFCMTLATATLFYLTIFCQYTFLYDNFHICYTFDYNHFHICCHFCIQLFPHLHFFIQLFSVYYLLFYKYYDNSHCYTFLHDYFHHYTFILRMSHVLVGRKSNPKCHVQFNCPAAFADFI